MEQTQGKHIRARVESILERKRPPKKGTMTTVPTVLAALGDIASGAAYLAEGTVPGAAVLTRFTDTAFRKRSDTKHIREDILDSAISTYINCTAFALWLANNRPTCLETVNFSEFANLLIKLRERITHLTSLSIFRESSEKSAGKQLGKYWKGTVNATAVGRLKDILEGIDATNVLRYIFANTSYSYFKNVLNNVIDYHIADEDTKAIQLLNMEVSKVSRAKSKFWELGKAIMEYLAGLLTESIDSEEFTESLKHVYDIESRFRNSRTNEDEARKKHYSGMTPVVSTGAKALGNVYKQDMDDIISSINELLLNIDIYYQHLVLDLVVSQKGGPCVNRKIAIDNIFKATMAGHGELITENTREQQAEQVRRQQQQQQRQRQRQRRQQQRQRQRQQPVADLIRFDSA